MSISSSRNSASGRVVEMALNLPQSEVHMVQAHTTFLFWGRGTGKTVGGISPWMVRIAESMPGHLSGIFGKSHVHLDTNIMPKILLGFTSLGYQQDKDFIVGKRPPKEWPKCLYPIKEYDRTITWRNGTTWQQVSMHEKGSANAFDFQSGVYDECKFFNKQQLEDEVFPTFRGFENLFGHLPEYLSKIFASDKLADYLEIEWLLAKRQEVDNTRVEKILKAQRIIMQLQQQSEKCSITKQTAIASTIKKLEFQCQQWRKRLVYVSEASAVDNIENLGVAWLADKKANMSSYEFNVAILNKDPEQSKEGFYPGLGDHSYFSASTLKVYDHRMPLIIALDYQHSIAPLLVAQLTDKLYIQKEFSALYPLGISNVVQQFANFYQFHAEKKIYYVYDQTAVGKRPEAEPLYMIVKKELSKHKWNIVDVYMGDTPDHFEKYIKINGHLQQEGKWEVLINEEDCPNLVTSMKAANSKMVQGKTKKDKEFENAGKYPHIDQRKTTHFTDVIDQILWAVNEQKRIKPGRKISTTTSFR